MTNIPIFDSLTHPTLDGNWILPKWPACASCDELLRQMEESGVCGSFAVGMESIGGYEESDFIQMVNDKGKGKLFPIAFLSLKDCSEHSIINQLQTIRRRGYVGIKLHPRMGGFMLDSKWLPFAIDTANSLGLAVLMCTYYYSNTQSLLANNVERLADLLLKVKPTSKVILLHGGVTRLLDVMEIVRAFPNTLLDLSLTLCKYAGSSLDMDIQFLFGHFDRRVCIGSDYPEIQLKQVRERFEHFAANTTGEKARNIAYRNIVDFTGINLNA